MMKKILAGVLTILTLATYAQKFQVETAAIAVKRYEDPSSNDDDRKAAIEEGKTAIDKAYTNTESQADAKMWYFRGMIYLYMASDPKLGYTDATAPETAAEAYIKCIQTDDNKKKYALPANKNLCEYVVGLLYNNAIVNVNSKDFAKAIYFYQKVADIVKYDSGKLMETKNNIFENELYYWMATAALQGSNEPNTAPDKVKSFRADAIKYYQMSIDKNYGEPNVFSNLGVLLLESGDTTRALQVVEQGRERFPSSQSLITTEINIYIMRKQVDGLISKLNGAIEARPEDAILYFIRGNSYQVLAKNEMGVLNNLNDTQAYLIKQIKSTADPKKKAALQARGNESKAKAEQSKARFLEYQTNCERDYKKSIELNDGLMDAFYGLGAYNLDMAAPLTEKLNDPNFTGKPYDDMLAKRNEYYAATIGNFEKALTLIKDDPETEQSMLFTLYQINAQMGKVDKANEYKAKADAAKAKIKK